MAMLSTPAKRPKVVSTALFTLTVAFKVPAPTHSRVVVTWASVSVCHEGLVGVDLLQRPGISGCWIGEQISASLPRRPRRELLVLLLDDCQGTAVGARGQGPALGEGHSEIQGETGHDQQGDCPGRATVTATAPSSPRVNCTRT